MSDQSVYFYTRHPISAAIILKKLREQRGHLDAVRPDELFAHDQDHYGGLAANDALAAAALTRLVGLSERVRVIGGNVMSVPLGDASIDAVISQEAMLHVPEKGRALREAFRILRRGRRLAFTDWTVNAPLGAEDADLLWRGMAAQSLQSV